MPLREKLSAHTFAFALRHCDLLFIICDLLRWSSILHWYLSIVDFPMKTSHDLSPRNEFSSSVPPTEIRYVALEIPLKKCQNHKSIYACCQRVIYCLLHFSFAIPPSHSWATTEHNQVRNPLKSRWCNNQVRNPLKSRWCIHCQPHSISQIACWAKKRRSNIKRKPGTSKQGSLCAFSYIHPTADNRKQR